MQTTPASVRVTSYWKRTSDGENDSREKDSSAPKGSVSPHFGMRAGAGAAAGHWPPSWNCRSASPQRASRYERASPA